MQIRLDCGYSLEVIDSKHHKQRRPSLRERLRTHKDFAVEQNFSCVLYAKYHQFSIKSYVVDVYLDCLAPRQFYYTPITYDFMETSG